MKHIGYIDGAVAGTWQTHSLGMISSHDLFIPTPGERENVNAEQWLLVGWLNPDSDGGGVYPTHADVPWANEPIARPAYIRQEQEPVPAPQPVISDMSFIAEVLEFCDEELNGFDGPEYDSDAEVCCQRSNVYIRELIRRLQSKPPSLDKSAAAQSRPEPPMTFYDHVFIAAYIAANETMNRDMATKDAHDTAGHLTRNRANQPCE